MEREMLSLFPGGLRVMLVDDDTKAVRNATAMLSTLNYPVVAAHPTASAGLRVLSGDNVQAVLCDVHKVVSSGFDFCLIIETELHIPVIYLLSTKPMVADEDAAFLNRLLETATYIVKKPLDSAVMAQLWRVVAWRNCCLGAVNLAAPAEEAAGGGGENDDDDVVIIEEPPVHFKAVRASGSRKRQLTINIEDDNRGSGGADANSTKILEHMNGKGLMMRQHIASHLQKYRAKQQKKDLADERRLLQADSLFLKAILPTLNVPPCNPLTIAGGAGPSRIATAAFAGGSAAAAPFQVPVFQQQQQQPASNSVISFNLNNNAAPVAVQTPAMGQQLFGGVQMDAPQKKLFLEPFSYQGPPPPAMQNHINLLPAFPPRVGMVMDKGKTPLIELPFGQPMDDLLVGETTYGGAGPSVEAPDGTAANAYAGALQNNAAGSSPMAPPMEPMFSITEPIVGTQDEGANAGAGTIVVASMENAAAVEAVAPNNAEPFMAPDQVDPLAPVAAEEDMMFSLESLLGLDDDVMLPLEDAAAGDAADGSLNGEEGGMDIGWDLDLDDILMNNTNEFSFLEDLAGSE